MTMIEAWARAEAIGRRQHGVVTAKQLEGCGLAREAMRWRVERRQLVRVFVGVYCFPAVRPTWEQTAQAALLWLGDDAALSHASAASLFCLDGFKRRPSMLDLIVPRNGVSSRRAKSLPGNVVLHRSRTAFATTRVAGFRVTDLARTVMDLATTVPPARGLDDGLDDALDSAQRMYPGTDGELERLYARARSGRTGTRRLRRLLHERGGLATDSPLEARFRRALRLGGLKAPRHQRPVFDARGYIVRVDFIWPDERVVVHVDGYEFHQQRTQFERDREVANRLTAKLHLSIWVTSRGLKESHWRDALKVALRERAPQLVLL